MCAGKTRTEGQSLSQKTPRAELKGHRKMRRALAGVGQWVGTSSQKVKGCRFDSRSGHMPGLLVRSLVRVGEKGNGSMFLSFSLSPFPSKNIMKYMFY